MNHGGERSEPQPQFAAYHVIIRKGNKAMALDLAQKRLNAHAYLDHLCPEQLSAVHGLLESMLSPLERTLALAPIDDEPVTEEDAAAIEAGIASLEQGRGVPMEKILADFGLAMEDLRKMAASSPKEDADQ
jgi:hypothetical protein